MPTAAVVIQALDAMYFNNYANTKSFVNANGVGIMMRAAFSPALLHNEAISTDFSSPVWMAALKMMKNMMTHRDRKRKIGPSTPGLSAASYEEAATALSMPFLHLVKNKFSNTARTDTLTRTEYTLTELIIMCLVTYMQCIRDKSKHHRPSDTIVCLCLSMLQTCMLAPVGMAEMRKIGITIVVNLKRANGGKKISSFAMDVACLEVIAMALSRTRMHDLDSGLFEITESVPGCLDGLCVKITDKMKQSNECVDGALRAQRGIETLRVALVRMQIKECMHLLLVAADDESDRIEIMKHTRVRIGSQEEVPCEMTHGESKIVSRCFRCMFFLYCRFRL